MVKQDEIFIARKHNAAVPRRKQAKRQVEADLLFRLLTQFGYDNAGRLQSVTNGNYTATYTYLANSPLISQISFKSNSVTRMTTTKSYHQTPCKNTADPGSLDNLDQTVERFTVPF